MDALDEQMIYLTRIPCHGRTIKNKPCRVLVTTKVEDADGKAYCINHQDQANGTKRSICVFRKPDGNACAHYANKAFGSSQQSVALCSQHREHRLDFQACAGSTSPGTRCTSFIQRFEPYFQFCDAHRDQAASFPCSLAELPNELAHMVLEKLRPIDRISFALANKSCVEVVRGWAARRVPRATAWMWPLNLLAVFRDDDGNDEQIQYDITSYPANIGLMERKQNTWFWYDKTLALRNDGSNRLAIKVSLCAGVAWYAASSPPRKNQLLNFAPRPLLHLSHAATMTALEDWMRIAPWLFQCQQRRCIACRGILVEDGGTTDIRPTSFCQRTRRYHSKTIWPRLFCNTCCQRKVGQDLKIYLTTPCGHCHKDASIVTSPGNSLALVNAYHRTQRALDQEGMAVAAIKAIPGIAPPRGDQD